MLQRILALGSASAINVALVALVNLLLAKTLGVEEFGIVRTVTAYLIILTMLGNFTLHDALTFHIARADDGEIRKYFSNAAFMTICCSCVTSIFAILIFSGVDAWQTELKRYLIYSCFLLPVLTLTILYNNSLQALGSHRAYALVTLMSAVVPLVIVLPASYAWSLPGWICGRFVAAGILLLIACFFVNEFISLTKISGEHVVRLWSFARVQFISGALSLTLMSVDIVYLEYVTHNLPMIAHYGLAQLFAKAPLFLATTISRSYFKEVSVSADPRKKIMEFLLLTTLVSAVVALAVYLVCPLLISSFYGAEYEAAGAILKVMALGIIFNFLWSAISTITVAQGRPSMAVKVSSVGAITGALLLYFLIPHYHALGAAWAMNIAYATGVMTGLYLVFKSKFEPLPGMLREKN
jgi:O-antigen/teichoic acid export membrane protein